MKIFLLIWALLSTLMAGVQTYLAHEWEQLTNDAVDAGFDLLYQRNKCEEELGELTGRRSV